MSSDAVFENLVLRRRCRQQAVMNPGTDHPVFPEMTKAGHYFHETFFETLDS